MWSEDDIDDNIQDWDDEVSVYSPKLHIVRVWNMFIAMTCLAAVTVSLYELFFNSTVQAVVFMRYCLDVIFIINIISRFYIGYENHGEVIIDPKRIRKKYLRTWFLMDILSVLPLETFKMPLTEFMHANRCLRVFRLFSIISSFKEPDRNKVLVTALRSFSIAVLSVQTSACIWFHQACKGTHNGQPRYCFKEENWLQLLPEFSTNLTGVSELEYYGTSLYWSVITLSTVGFGDIHATNFEEATVASFVMVVGLIVLPGIMASLSSITYNMDAQRGKFYHRMETVHHYVTNMGLPKTIWMWVHAYYYYLWIHQKGCVIPGLLDDLPYVLRSDISSWSYKPLMEKAKLFRDTKDDFKRALTLNCNTYTYNSGQTLTKIGDINQNLYYIKYGLVQVLGENPCDKIATLLPGSLFGEVHLLYKIPRNATMCALTLCEICVLEHKDLLSLFADYPEARVKIARAAKKHLQNFKHPLQEAFAYGVASHPQNVVFEKDMSIYLPARDRRIFRTFMEHVLNQSHWVQSLVKNKTKLFWKRTFNPESAFIKNWEFFFFWCMTVSVFLETWVLFFTNNAETMGLYNEGLGAFYLAFGAVIDIVAAFDILVNLRTEVITENGYVTDFTTIFLTYRKSWNLYYDVLAILPLDFISFAYNGLEHWRILGQVRLNRLMWLRRIYLYFYKKECDMHKNLLEQRIAKCLFLLIFCVHFCAGVLYLSACLEVRCHEESWAWNAGLKSAQSNFYHYVQAAYWATSTMTSVGYGDIIPNSLTERLLAVVVGIAGLLIFSYFIGQIFATISGENANRWTYQNLLSEMRHFMDQHDLTVFQQNRVIKYMNLLWFKYQGDAYPGGPFLMRDLPPELKQTVLMTERGKLLLNIPYFEEAGQSFIQDLALVSVMYFFPKGEIIQYRNTITRELFCIRRGTCQILNDNLSEIVGCYQKEMYFGEAGFLFGKQAILTVRAATCCEILVIDFDKVSVVLEKHPVIKRQIEELQANSEFYKTMVETSEKLMRTYCKLPEETGGVQRKEKVPLTFQGRRYFEKSKCYIEYFGNIHIYAGSEEETVAEHLQKLQSEQLGLQRPRSLKEHIPQFLLKSCLSFFLMKSAILPSNALFVGWEFFRTVLAVAVSVISSLLFAFLHYKIEMWIACYILGSLCWIDIYIRMHVAFYKDNDLKVDTLETAYHYLNTSFLMDFITCFPWELIGWAVVSPFSENGFYANNEALHFYAYLRIPHIFQLYRVHLVFSYLQSDISAEINIITFLKLLLYSILFIHFSTCIVFATVCPLVDLYGDVNMYLLPMIKHNCTPSSWVTHLDSSFNVDFATVTFAQLYSTSFYFAATTVCGVGFGDIHPHLTLMKVSMIIIMVAGTLFCGWFSGTVTAMLANADATRIAYTERIESMKLFLKSHKITGALYDSVIGYYTFRWMLTEGIDQEKLFKYLPSSIVGDISTVIYADFITKVFGLYLKNQIELETHQLSPLEIRKAGKLNGPFFELMLTKENMEQLETDGCFIRMLTRKIRPCFFRASDLIYKKSDYGSEMYFIKKGEVDVLANDHLTVLFKLKAGQYFGERSLLLGEPRAATIRAASTCHLYVLSKKSLDETFKYYPSIQEQIERAADMMKDQLYQGDHQLKTQRKPDSADESSFRDSGYLKLYRECMAEEEHRAKLRALPLHIKLRTRVKEIFTKVFNTISRIHNKTIDPENTFRVIYQYVSCLLTTVSFCSITYMLTVYDVDWNVFMLTMIVECIQIIEIFLKFHISFYDDSGKYISDRKSISQNYMKRKVGYVFDLVCSFPYDFIVLHQMSEKEPEEFLSIIVYTRTVQLLRIISLLVFMWREEQSITTNLLYIRIITCLVYIIVFVHCVALLLIYFVRVNGLGSWVSETEIVDFPEMYRYAVYWVLQMYTTTGYGDITPATLGEMTACVVVMVLSKIQASYKMGLLISPETNKRKLHEDYEENLQTIRTYMMDEKIPSELQKRVLQFYRYRWTRTNGTELEVLFKDIPHCLKMEIMSRICIQFLRKHQLFNHLPEPFLRELSTRMHIRCFPVGEYIYRKGDTSTGMYLILIGKVKLCPDTRGTKIIQHLSVGAAFGEHFLLKCTLFRDTAIAANCVDIAILSKDSFDEVGVLYPDVMNKLLNRAADVLKL